MLPTPVPMHASVHVVAVPQCPVGPHVSCWVEFTHWVVPDMHSTQPLFRQNGVVPAHLFVHVPQLLTSVLSFTHAVPQTTFPTTLHACTQLVPLHVTVPPVGLAHIVQLGPHAATSFATHVPEHVRIPLAHWHEPTVQCWPPAHAFPHPLQLLSSLVSSTHAPLQSVYPLLQAIVQTLAAHFGWPWTTPPQECMQVAQLLGSVAVSTHVPPQSDGVEPEQPVTHEYVLPEPEQTGAEAGQTVPQAPQLDGFEMSVSQPRSGLAAQ
jgi:hypothetical protein